jgi:hypothetical protein
LRNSWVAIESTTDRRRRARQLAAAHDAVLGGGSPVDGMLRDVIVGSWERCRQAGVDADAGSAPVGDEAAARDRWAAHPLARAVPAARELLADVGAASEQVLLFCDVDGTLLWIEGERDLVHRARDVRLTPGADWSERAAGTNAMGTALVTSHPLQVFSAEHYTRAVHGWTCSAAPIRDPETGRTIGVLDLSGELDTAHPHSLAVVTAATRLVEQELRRAADRAAAELVEAFGDRVGAGGARAQGLATANGRVLLAARDGLAGRHVAIPRSGGLVALPGGGAALAEPLPQDRGYLLWPAARPSIAAAAELRIEALGRDRARLHVDGVAHTLSPRHSELLLLLALRPAGWTAEQLAVELLGDFGKPGSIRVELSRLRRILGARLQAQPYRLAARATSDVQELERCVESGRVSDALDRLADGDPLPGSDAPTIAETRFRLTMSVREAVIASRDPELLRRWISLPGGEEDVQACRALITLCAPADPRHALAAGRLRRLTGVR